MGSGTAATASVQQTAALLDASAVSPHEGYQLSSQNGIVSSVSFVSTTNTASSLTSCVLLAWALTRRHLYAKESRPALSIQQSLYRHERGSTLVLDQDHQEFRRIGSACVAVNDMNIVRAFIEALSGCQCYLLSPLQLHHNGALQYVNKRMCIVSVDSARPAGRILHRDHQSFPAGTLRKIFGHERRDLRLLSQCRAAHEA